jgi:hypothetical protein
MSKPFITFIHTKNNLWKLLVIFDSDTIYYSQEYSHSELRDFKYPHNIEISDDDKNIIIIHSHNNKKLLTLKKLC